MPMIGGWRRYRRAGELESRPYKRLKSDELLSLARREAGSVSVLTGIKAEMAHRGAHPAADDVRDLVAELLHLVEQRPASRRHKAPPTRPRGVQPTGRTSDPGDRGPVPDVALAPLVDHETRYNMLRETFTAESEVLARWGMTSALPATMRHVVFEAWHKRLAQRQDPRGLTLADLERDLKTLKTEHGYTFEDERDGR